MHNVQNDPSVMYTSEIRAVWKTGCDFAVLGNNIDDAFLYEVHFSSDRSFLDDVVARLKHLVFEFRHYVGDEVRVGVRKERDGRYQRSAVVVDDFLRPVNNQTKLLEAQRTQISAKADHVGVTSGCCNY